MRLHDVHMMSTCLRLHDFSLFLHKCVYMMSTCFACDLTPPVLDTLLEEHAISDLRDGHTVGMRGRFEGTLRDIERILRSPAPGPVHVSGALQATFQFVAYENGYAEFWAGEYSVRRVDDRLCVFGAANKPLWHYNICCDDDWESCIPSGGKWRAVLRGDPPIKVAVQEAEHQRYGL